MLMLHIHGLKPFYPKTMCFFTNVAYLFAETCVFKNSVLIKKIHFYLFQLFSLSIFKLNIDHANQSKEGYSVLCCAVPLFLDRVFVSWILYSTRTQYYAKYLTDNETIRSQQL